MFWAFVLESILEGHPVKVKQTNKKQKESLKEWLCWGKSVFAYMYGASVTLIPGRVLLLALCVCVRDLFSHNAEIVFLRHGCGLSAADSY